MFRLPSVVSLLPKVWSQDEIEAISLSHGTELAPSPAGAGRPLETRLLQCCGAPRLLVEFSREDKQLQKSQDH